VEAKDNYYIAVTDDGVGFSDEYANDSEIHIGIDNVRKRLSLLIGGTLVVDSVPGRGTTCTVIIPKEVEVDDRIMRG